MDIFELFRHTYDAKASDLHITVGIPPVIRANGSLRSLAYEALTPTDVMSLLQQIMKPVQLKELENKHELDFSFSHSGFGRFRVNVYKQRGTFSAAFRSVMGRIPSIEELGLPPVINELTSKQRGLILVTGPTGSGKTTTLAYMIDKMNHERKSHIITLEDPIEYLYKHDQCIINQREVGSDVDSFSNGLRAALRQDPDVILVGEMRDLETISIAVTAAETGHLVLSTLHTVGAAKTIDRIVDVFPPHQQQQIRIQLSTVLEGIVSQQLLPTADQKSRTVAVEVMLANNAIRNLIRENKTYQIQNVIQTGAKQGMQTMDGSLLSLYRQGTITQEDVFKYCMETDIVRRYIN
ncbi:type IV pilus twitching motility protein PilT [Dehalobacter sp. DCM]|uniref:type IV pilus twitching motility protein PilT n=1 Tax=Dehalobacter sp. DCM TaxID=2907827 RepID=UPI0030813802|nr:type IV pilus twitching motility protein PilT [Dehalobacter sp. DCM]